jgi:translocation protein SEC62
MASAQQQGPGGPNGPGIQFQFPPGQQPSPEQIRQIQAQLIAEAAKQGITVEQYVQKLRAQHMEMQRQQAAGQQGEQHKHPHQHEIQHPHQHPHHLHQQPQTQQQQVPINQGPPEPRALALANFLKSQNLKTRTCILNGQRKDMFKGEML